MYLIWGTRFFILGIPIPHMRYTCTSYYVPKSDWFSQYVRISAIKRNFEKNLSGPSLSRIKKILAKISAKSEGVRGPHMRYICTSYHVHMYLIWGIPVLHMRYMCTSYEEFWVCIYWLMVEWVAVTLLCGTGCWELVSTCGSATIKYITKQKIKILFLNTTYYQNDNYNQKSHN